MDKDRVAGKVEDVKGRVKRQVGEWTGNEETQSEGAAQQIKGKIQNAWGEAKDAARNVLKHNQESESESEKSDKDEDKGAA
jgi:uncharacterized protein YjbJ (UPF0337 family)